MKNGHQKLFVAVVIAFLALPLGHIFGLKATTHLAGVDPQTDLPSLQKQKFRTREFQKEFEKWWQSHYAFRKICLKTKNHLYDLVNFGSFHSGYNYTLIEGNGEHLYERRNIDTIYNGNCSVDHTRIIQKLKDIKRYARQKNIPLLFVLGPNKARLNEDDVPYRFKYFSPRRCNHIKEWKKALTKIDFPFFDAENFFEKNSEKEEIEPYSQTGTHLNKYGAARLAQKLAEKLGLPEIEIKEANIIDDETFGERDIANLINTWKKYKKKEKFLEVKVELKNNQKPPHLNIVLIGDSYAGPPYHYFVFSGLIPGNEKLVSANRELTEDDANWYWNNADIILFVSSEPNLEIGDWSPQSQINSLWEYLPPAMKTIYEPLEVKFSDQKLPFEVSGLSFAEGWGRWTDGDIVKMSFLLSERKNYKFSFKGTFALIHEKNPKVVTDIYCGNRHIAKWELENKDNITDLSVKKECLDKNNRLNLIFKIKGAARPVDLGINPDQRKLAIGFHTLEITGEN